MKTTTTQTRSRGAAWAAVAFGLLLLTACNQQWPPPPPVPGQPLTFAQKHYRDMQQQEQWRDQRFR